MLPFEIIKWVIIIVCSKGMWKLTAKGPLKHILNAQNFDIVLQNIRRDEDVFKEKTFVQMSWLH